MKYEVRYFVWSHSCTRNIQLGISNGARNGNNEWYGYKVDLNCLSRKIKLSSSYIILQYCKNLLLNIKTYLFVIFQERVTECNPSWWTHQFRRNCPSKQYRLIRNIWSKCNRICLNASSPTSMKEIDVSFVYQYKI